MWHLNSGDDAVLDGKIARLFKLGCNILSSDWSCFCDPGERGAAVTRALRNLSVEELANLLRTVAWHLLHSKDKPPELTALNEAMVHEAFVAVEGFLDPETNDKTIQAFVIDAIEELFQGKEGEKYVRSYRKKIKDNDVTDAIESLMDVVLWDRDFDDLEDISDLPPEQAAAMRGALGVHDEYFMDVPRPIVPLAQALADIDAMTMLPDAGWSSSPPRWPEGDILSPGEHVDEDGKSVVLKLQADGWLASNDGTLYNQNGVPFLKSNGPMFRHPGKTPIANPKDRGRRK